MHGGFLFSTPIISIIIIIIGLFFLYLSIKQRTHIRNINDPKILDTSIQWVYFTFFVGSSALGAHLLAEYQFHIYDITPIDVFTHGLSGMAVTALILNFNLTRKRKLYYFAGIGTSWIAFIAWEIFEGIYFQFNPLGTIQTNTWDTMIDLWVDTLGALSICFLCDELVE